MKNQYVADENDYRKYGLLRCLANGEEMSIGVVWMLTEDDGGKDGGKIDYLDKPWEWKHHDEPLFKGLTDIVKASGERNVRQVQDLDLLPHAGYFEEVLMDDVQHRRIYFSQGFERFAGKDLLFFDPDNGMEVRSKPLGIKGRKDSCKYLYFQEIKEAFQRGHSLLIYQHFPRKKRQAYIQQRASELLDKVKGIDEIFSFSTSNVCFFLVSQERHTQYFKGRLGDIGNRWGRQFAVKAHEKVGVPPLVRETGCPLTGEKGHRFSSSCFGASKNGRNSLTVLIGGLHHAKAGSVLFWNNPAPYASFWYGIPCGGSAIWRIINRHGKNHAFADGEPRGSSRNLRLAEG